MCHTVRVNMASASALDVIQTISIGICISTGCHTNPKYWHLHQHHMLCKSGNVPEQSPDALWPC